MNRVSRIITVYTLRPEIMQKILTKSKYQIQIIAESWMTFKMPRTLSKDLKYSLLSRHVTVVHYLGLLVTHAFIIDSGQIGSLAFAGGIFYVEYYLYRLLIYKAF